MEDAYQVLVLIFAIFGAGCFLMGIVVAAITEKIIALAMQERKQCKDDRAFAQAVDRQIDNVLREAKF